MSTVAGKGEEGCMDGEANKSSFRAPYGVALVEPEGHLLVTDCLNNKIRRIRTNNGVSSRNLVREKTNQLI